MPEVQVLTTSLIAFVIHSPTLSPTLYPTETVTSEVPTLVRIETTCCVHVDVYPCLAT